MPRLTAPVTLDNDLSLEPPLATDSSSLDAANLQASFGGSLVGTFKTPPVVFLARYTDRGLVKARADLHTPALPGDPTDQLVVAIVGFGWTTPVGGAEGHTGPQPTEAGDLDGRTIFWTLDPVTGGALRGGNYPGAPPAISTSPPTG